jgi:putative hemolysin
MISRPEFIVLTLAMVILAGLFEGAETGIYRLSRLRLRLGVEHGRWAAILLARVMRDSSGLLLSLLIGTNLAQYLATSFVTRIFLDIVTSEHLAELYTTLLTAPLLFVFAQLIPKNAFLQRPNLLTLFIGPLLYVSHKVFTWCGLVPLLKLLSRLFTRLIGSPVSSATMLTSSQGQQVRAILQDTLEEGLLSRVQTEMVDRIVNIPGLHLSTVMVPLAQVQSVPLDSDRAALLEQLRQQPRTRMPVWQDTPTNIIGFINVYEVLGTGASFASVKEFLQPIRRLDADTLVVDAIDVMRREQVKIVLVTRRGRREAPVGIATMKDLVEELMGELTEW